MKSPADGNGVEVKPSIVLSTPHFRVGVFVAQVFDFYIANVVEAKVSEIVGVASCHFRIVRIFLIVGVRVNRLYACALMVGPFGLVWVARERAPGDAVDADRHPSGLGEGFFSAIAEGVLEDDKIYTGSVANVWG